MRSPSHALCGYTASLLLIFSTLATAQMTTGDILGTVSDTTGAVVPNAQVTITNLGTQQTRKMSSTGSGDYVFNLLQPGRYSLRIEVSGFKSYDVREVIVGAGDRIRVDARMQVGEVSESVEVKGEAAPALQTDSSTVQDVVTERAVQDLPLNGRNFIGLVQVTAGVNAGPPNAISSGNRPDDRRPTSSFSANGQSDLFNNQMVDGLDNNERIQGLSGLRPSVDGIAEVRVLTNNYSATYGRTAGAIVNIITKAGSNQFHGSVYEYFRNDIFDARDFFAASTPEYRQNQFGGSLGGPIVKNRTFFFGDVEESRIVQGRTFTSTVPTLYEQQHPGDFSDIGGSVVPPALINPIALSLFKLLPAPNKPGRINNYVSSPNKTQFSTALDGRIDHRFNDNNSVFVRYGFNPVSTFTPGAFPAVDVSGTKVDPSPDYYAGPSKSTAQGVQIDYVHIFTPSLLLDLKAGYTRINIQSLPLNYGMNLSQKFGIINSNISDDSSALSPMMFLAGDYSDIGGGLFMPILNVNNIFQYNGAVSYTRGSHNIKMGAALIRRQVNWFQDALSPQGGFIYLPTPPFYNSMANFLAGFAIYTQRGNTLVHPGYRMWEPSAYIQDDWRATRWLTLNLGLRYEVFTPFTEVANRMSNFNIKTLKIEQAGVDTSSTLGVSTNYKDFAPRIGFAATLPWDLVLRGGFGISYYPTDIQGAGGGGNAPYVYTCYPCVGATFPTLILPSSDPSKPSGGVGYKPPDFRSAYIKQFNLFLQKGFRGNVFTIGGVGEVGRRLLYQTDLDRPAPPGAGNPKPALLYASQLPLVGNITVGYNGAISNYYALQAAFTRRYSRGLTLNANYTWAHGLTNTVNGSGSTNPIGLIPGNPLYDYGNSDIDIRHRIAISANYEIPVAKSLHGVPGTILRGWQINTIAFWQTGLPFTVTNSSPRLNIPGITSDRPDQIAPADIGNPTVEKWFNTAAFAPQVLGTAGSEGRNPLYGPPARSVNLSLLKNFALAEPWRLQFRAECFNISNTANFANPSSSLGAPGFGVISATAVNSTPRQFQFALKLLF